MLLSSAEAQGGRQLDDEDEDDKCIDVSILSYKMRLIFFLVCVVD